MLVFTILLSTLLIYSVKPDTSYILKEPTYHEHSKFDFNKSKMFSSMASYIADEECEPIRLWICVRHGTKYPSQDVLDDIFTHITPVKNLLEELYNDKNHNNYNSLKKNEQNLIDSLIKWNNVMGNGSHKELNENGEKAIGLLAKKIKKKFQTLATNIKSYEIEVLTAIEDRCYTSAIIFLMEFLKKDTLIKVNLIRNTMADDRLKLQKPSEEKIKVLDSTDKINKNNIYVEDLYYKIKYPEIKKRIGKLLYPDHIENHEEKRELLTSDVIKTMYYACAHGYYYFDNNGNKTDAWCKVFNYDDFKIFEDMHDLQYYYKNGYYDKDTPKLGNAIVEDILFFLKQPNGMKFKLFTGHTSNCLSIITRLNLFRDKEKLTIKNIDRMTNRKWRTSNISPTLCNIMVAVYDCKNEDLQVTIYINEEPVEVELRNAYDTFHCIKCPLNEIVKILLTLNLRDKDLILPPSTKQIKKKNKKEKKLKEILENKSISNSKKYEEYIKERNQNVLPTRKFYDHTAKKEMEKKGSITTDMSLALYFENITCII